MLSRFRDPDSPHQFRQTASPANPIQPQRSLILTDLAPFPALIHPKSWRKVYLAPERSLARGDGKSGRRNCPAGGLVRLMRDKMKSR